MQKIVQADYTPNIMLPAKETLPPIIVPALWPIQLVLRRSVKKKTKE